MSIADVAIALGNAGNWTSSYDKAHNQTDDDATRVLQSDSTLEVRDGLEYNNAPMGNGPHRPQRDTCGRCTGHRRSPSNTAKYNLLGPSAGARQHPAPCLSHTNHQCATTSDKPTLVLRTFSGGWVADELPPEDTAGSAKQPDVPDERSVHGASAFQQHMTQPPRRTSRLAAPEAPQSSPPMSDSASADQQHQPARSNGQSMPRPAFKRRMDDALPTGGANTAPVGNHATTGEEPTVKGGRMAFDLLQAAMQLANQPPQRRKKSTTSLKKIKSDSKINTSAPTPPNAPNAGGLPVAAPNGTVLASAIAQVESLQQHNLQLLLLNSNLERELDSTKRMMFLQHQELMALRVQVQHMNDGGLAVPVAPSEIA